MRDRRFAAGAALVVAACLLAGCAPATESAAPSPAVTAEPAATAAPTPEPTPDHRELPDEWFNDAVFVGDSVSRALMHYCEETGELGDAIFLCENSFSVRNAVQNIIDVWYQGEAGRIDSVLERTGARKIFIMLGTNDVGLTGTAEGPLSNWRIMVNMIRHKNPDATVFIQSCLPMYYDSQLDSLNNDLLDEYNELLRAYCRDAGCVYVDIVAPFKDERNSLAEEYCEDQYVHLKIEAGELWVRQLRDPANYSVDPRSIDDGEAD